MGNISSVVEEVEVDHGHQHDHHLDDPNDHHNDYHDDRHLDHHNENEVARFASQVEWLLQPQLSFRATLQI